MMEQLSIFDLTMPYIYVDKPIRLIELFSGVGSQAMALRDLGADFEHYRSVEFDEHAVRSYNAIHGTNFPVTDIRNVHGTDLGIVDKDTFTYLLTYSFPCQDLSAAGKRKGMKKGYGTRSGLLWEVERLLNETPELPDILLMENVPEVIGANNIDDFHLWQDFLASKGYTNYVKILNAKDYGVAQNRNRCFMVSLLGQYNYHFPEPIPLNKCIDDYCEENVDESYYINTKKAQRKLTPRECWRLMGFSDEDYEKAAEVNSKTQLYKQSGNSIVKQVLMAIFSQLNIKGVSMWNEVHHGTK